MTVEAMAAGVPVVATRVGGLAEMVVDGETGLLVTVHPNDGGRHRVDVDELASAQLRLLTDAELAQRMSRAGRRRVMSEYTLDKMVSETVQVYRQVVAEQNMPHRRLRRMARM